MFEKEVKEITDAAAALQTKLAAVETKLDQVSARLEQLSAKLDEVLLDPPESAR